MEKIIDKCKSFIELFSKQTSLNVIVFTCFILSGIIYNRTHNDIVFYVFIGSGIFFMTNIIVRYTPIIKKQYDNRKSQKNMNDPKRTRKLLLNLDDASLKLLWELYNIYPEADEYDINLSSLQFIKSVGMVLYNNILIPYDVNKYYQRISLEPWVYKSIKNNEDLFEKFNLKDE